jgi:hypothetical protein
MSIFDNLRSYEFDRNKKRVFGIKSAIIWGHSKNSNSCSPLLYISKPRGITNDEFNELLDSLIIGFKQEGNQ